VQTPVDMSHYADHSRLRPEQVRATPGTTLSIARRPLVDLPLAMAAGAADPVGSGSDHIGDQLSSSDNVEDSGSSFDVPAFLRRQEG
jgi:hypothetical protein